MTKKPSSLTRAINQMPDFVTKALNDSSLMASYNMRHPIKEMIILAGLFGRNALKQKKNA